MLVKARAALLVTLWRNWSVRNDLTHGGTSVSIIGWVQVIESMLKHWSFRESEMLLDDVKGKLVIGESKKMKERELPMISCNHLGQHLYGLHLSTAG